jgi:aspartate carbamoyltransferase catalytic subunit
MRSFEGRDILSLKDFERQEFFRVFDVAEQMEPFARNRHY